MTEVSEDIFFQVKKQILDKLDIILQKINLEIINYIKPQEDQFTFIELSYFQTEITHLFSYLDRLYASLNSSVSFSSIQSYKESAEHYQMENERLAEENEKLKKLIEQLSSDSLLEKGSTLKLVPQINQTQQMRDRCLSKLEPLKVQIKSLADQFKTLLKHVKKQLKNHKFQMLQTRVEVISKLKDLEPPPLMSSQQKYTEQCSEIQHLKNNEQILETIAHILSIC